MSTESGAFFVECTTYRKSFALEGFISELFGCIDTRIKVGHVPCLLFSLPKDKDIESFLDGLFKPYLNPKFLPQKLKESEKLSPLALPVPSCVKNLYVYLENPDADNYNHKLGQTLTSAGEPKDFLEVALKELLSVIKHGQTTSRKSTPTY